MSNLLNLICPICKEPFQNNENIYSTSCGHVLHYNCLTGWLNCSDVCPQCRNPSPSSHKIYLNFDESADVAEDLKKLQVIHDEAKKNIDRLNDDLAARDVEIRELGRKGVELTAQYDERLRQENMVTEALKERMKKVEKKNIDQLRENEKLAEILESLKASTAETNRELEEEKSKSQVLNERNISLIKEIEKLKSEVLNAAAEHAKYVELMAEYSKMDSGSRMQREKREDSESQTILYMEKNKVLEQKLKYLTAEFEKEISKSTQLEIDNMKLQKLVESMKSHNDSNNYAPLQEKKPNFPIMKTVRKSALAASNESLNSTKNERSYNFFDSSSNSIVIQKYPALHLLYPLEDVIICVGKQIGIDVNKSEIDKVNIVKAKSKKLCQLVSLFVRFKTKEMKTKFLVHKNSLLSCSVPYLRMVQIREYIDDGSQHLFVYAKMKLKNHGFNDIFRTNNQIFAKRNMSDVRGIRILSCEQVDDLIKLEGAKEDII